MQRETELRSTQDFRSSWAILERKRTARRGVLALALIVLASLALRLQISSQCALWLDEASTFLDVGRHWPAVLAGPSREHPPLMYVVVKLVTGVLGTSETALRAVSLFFGCILLIAMYELCRELRLNVARSLVVVATLALCPFFIRHTTEARQYAMLAAFITLATTRVVRGPGRFLDVFVFAVAALAAAYTQYFGLAYALALLGTMLLGIPRAWRRVGWLGWVLRIGVLVGLLKLLGDVAVRAAALGRFYDTSRTVTDAGISINTDLLRAITDEFSFFVVYDSKWFVVEPLLVLLGLTLLTWRLRGPARLLPFGIGVAPCIAVLFISAGHFIAARYLVPSAIFYHLAACLALFEACALAQRALTRSARAKVFARAAAALVLATLFSLRFAEFPVGYAIGLADYRGLQRYLVDHAKDTRLVAFYGYFGQILMGRTYDIGSNPIRLESFRPVRGIDHYLVAEFHVGNSPERNAELESRVERLFALSPEAWRSLPLVPLAHSSYQPPVMARLVEVPKGHVYPAFKKRRHPKRRAS